MKQQRCVFPAHFFAKYNLNTLALSGLDLMQFTIFTVSSNTVFRSLYRFGDKRFLMEHTVTLRTRRRQLFDARHDPCRFSCLCSGSISAHISTFSPTGFMFYHVTINNFKDFFSSRATFKRFTEPQIFLDFVLEQVTHKYKQYCYP
jgi:hypothetical protein